VTSILSVRDLEKSFGRVIAARDISLDVPVEQTIGIIGANGAGKTTFINMITGHLRPTKGSIAFEGREITGRAPREIARLGIARSFQVAQIFPSLTLFENMCAAAAVARGPDSTLRRALMERFELEDIDVFELPGMLELIEHVIARHRAHARYWERSSFLKLAVEICQIGHSRAQIGLGGHDTIS